MIRHSLLLFIAVGWFAGCSSSQPKNQSPPATVKAEQQVSPPVTDPSLIPPEIVQVEHIDFAKGTKRVTMSNTLGKYILACDAKGDSCINPGPGRNYLLFNKNTKWKFSDSEDYVTRDYLMQWIWPYKGENIVIIPADADGNLEEKGIYWLVSWRKNK